MTAEFIPDAPGKLVISSIVGDDGRLSLDAEGNCVGIAARAALELMGLPSAGPSAHPGIALSLEKGLPLGSGMGSSAASAAAAAAAVNALFGSPLGRLAEVQAGLVSEGVVAGFHADNIAPAVLGGFVHISSAKPLVVDPLLWGSAAAYQVADEDEEGEGDATSSSSSPSSLRRSPTPLKFVLVNPKFEAPTAKMRAALPKTIPVSQLVHNAANGAALVAAILRGDAAALGRALAADAVVEPARAPLIPGFAAVKEAASLAGAFGATISGAGPTAVAVVADERQGSTVAEAMAKAFKDGGNLDINSIQIVDLDEGGARVLYQQ